MYLQDIFTVQANLTGHPSISVPIRSDFPVGAQFIGKYGGDVDLISFAQYIQNI